VTDVQTLHDYAVELLEACSEAVATTVGGPIERALVAAGSPALDCCDQLVVNVAGLSLENTSPTTPVTAPSHRLTTTGQFILAAYQVTVTRCVTVVDDDQGVLIPTPAELTADAQKVNEDIWAIWNVVAAKCLAGELFGGRCKAVYFDPPVPLDTSGGCGGWVWLIRPSIDGYQTQVVV
jgi:hypothetical protein